MRAWLRQVEDSKGELGALSLPLAVEEASEPGGRCWVWLRQVTDFVDHVRISIDGLAGLWGSSKQVDWRPDRKVPGALS